MSFFFFSLHANGECFQCLLAENVERFFSFFIDSKCNLNRKQYFQWKNTSSTDCVLHIYTHLYTLKYPIFFFVENGCAIWCRGLNDESSTISIQHKQHPQKQNISSYRPLNWLHSMSHEKCRTNCNDILKDAFFVLVCSPNRLCLIVAFIWQHTRVGLIDRFDRE